MPQAFDVEQQLVLLKHMRSELANLQRVEDLAKVLGYSKFHFLRRFQATFGRTPYQYLVDLRVEVAKAWLDEPGNSNISWIATQCGFAHTSTFIRAFRQRTGTTPARYAAAATAS
jgi:AraC family transcriptional regulator